jgi:hypothetical protein
VPLTKYASLGALRQPHLTDSGQRFLPGIGAEIMGAGKFGPPGWQDDPEWTGWWGPNPPFHTPTFVLTHRPRPLVQMEGGTTFHFLDASPAEALEQARTAADAQDVRIGGGPTVVRDFLAAGLVDYLHVTVAPIVLGRGVRLWDGHVFAQRRHPRDVQPPVDAKPRVDSLDKGWLARRRSLLSGLTFGSSEHV